ncbi:hypothetical protein [Actinokineospora sp. NBRC 105648]|uniref:hypothetical protein n=1 Tax=Actinokineospora sp. NBRC 105648 TaxID=3032206 RepID=UPI0024A5B15D|nr:hypothetical protein [Actinokineospora sp. NBRC 105648]GLZ41512.1 hypothetical protein Acsp05_51360 [Actinokineospora sp. NBRC 105648]
MTEQPEQWDEGERVRHSRELIDEAKVAAAKAEQSSLEDVLPTSEPPEGPE